MSFEIDQDALMETVTQTLEETAFLFVEESDRETSPWEGDRILHARIHFHGPAEGTIALAVEEQFAVELAANLLGVDGAAAEAVASATDAFGELVNILCGVLLEEWFPGDTTYGMGVPQVRSLPVASYESESSGAHVRLTFMTDEEKRIDATVFA